MKTSIRFVGFDLDNTLYDQAQYMLSFFRDVADDLAPNHAKKREEIYASFVETWEERTSYYPKLFDEALEKSGLFDEGLLKDLVVRFRNHRPTLTLFPGVQEMLELLTKRFTLFMITDGHHTTQQTKIDVLHLAPYFQEIMMTGKYGKDWSKPSLLAYRMVLQNLGGLPGEYLYVGDNPRCDFFGAKTVGMQTVQVLTQPFCRESMIPDDHAADRTIRNITELKNILL